MNIRITNLNLNLIESDLQRLFTPFGEIRSVHLVRDKLNNRSRGSAFIEMPVEKEAENAITNLQGKLFAGKIIDLKKALDYGDPDNSQINVTR